MKMRSFRSISTCGLLMVFGGVIFGYRTSVCVGFEPPKLEVVQPVLAPIHEVERVEPTPEIDKKIIAKYEELGAVYGKFNDTPDGPMFKANAGQFNMKFDYDDCDQFGNKNFDLDRFVAQSSDQFKRLTAE